MGYTTTSVANKQFYFSPMQIIIQMGNVEKCFFKDYWYL